MRKIYSTFTLVLLSLMLHPSAQGMSKTTQKAPPRVVRLTPPVLAPATTLQKICCTRPVREGMFDISVKTFTTQNGRSKQVINCCGMGGSGWTVLHEAVYEAIRLLEKEHISKKTPIRIIGAGCFGLLSALELTDRGYHVVGITAKELYDLPSWKAGGCYGVSHVNTSPEDQERLNKLSFDTFKAYQSIERGECPYLSKDAARMMPLYCSEDVDSCVDELVANGYIPPAEQVTLDFGNGVTHKNFRKFMNYYMDTTKLMEQMSAEVKKRGIKITCTTLSSFEECKEPVLFNCNGLGSRELKQDTKIAPVRGHLMTLNEHAGTAHMEYMLFTKVIQDGKRENINLFPKNKLVTATHPEGIPCQGVLGGTAIPDTEQLSPEELKKLDQTAFKKMIERCREFFLWR